ncbi:MAG: PASTA domain-containing protein [Clostridiales bacterium]|nr:PASTA domain-containing protein [Clostridiales bacterium]
MAVKRKKHRLKLAVPTTKPARPFKARLLHTLIAYGIVFIILTVLLFVIQVIMGPNIARSALSQWTRTTVISASRGEITDSTGKLLATNGLAYKVVIWPKRMDSSDRERAASELSALLGLNYETVLKRCKSTQYQEIVLKRQIDSATRDAVEALKLGNGVGTAVDSKRYYPMGSLLSQVLGFTNVDNVGQAGIELYYNEYLSGTDGRRIAETDNSGNPLAYGVDEYVAPIDGLNMTLTVNSVMQRYLESRLAEAVAANNAKGAQGIIMDCTNGAILAVASMPDYDLNNPPRDDLELLNQLSRNRIVTDVYEPGSTFKIITLAAALDSKAVSASSSFSCGGSYSVNGEAIHCWKHSGHGSQTLTEAAENSCNCAFMRMALAMGKSTFYDYIYAFGFGQSTESGMLGETGGIVTHQKYVTDNDLARIGFGQSIAVTPIQLAAAVSAAVNGGYLYKPYVIQRMTDKDGNVVFEANTAPLRQVITGETSAKVRKILQSVVDNGTGRNARIEGYAVGGKTGTAQKYDEYGRVDPGRYICSFIGFAPADNPRYVCLILVDEPHVASIFGSTVAAPFVKAVLEDVLHYSGIAPTLHQETVEVPDVKGLSAEEATAKLAEVGLYAVCQSSDEVIAQIPAAGETVVKGYQVLLYTGIDAPEEPFTQEKTYVTVPNLRGYTPLKAYDLLRSLGLIMATDTQDPAGYVYAQSVAPGTKVEVGSTIDLWFRMSLDE